MNRQGYIQTSAQNPATQVAVLPGPLYRILFDTESVIRNVTVHALSTLVFRLMAELEQIHSRKLEQRLANFLLLRASADGMLPMTQQEIACHLGTTRESLARIFRQFVAKRFTLTKRGTVMIAQPARLADTVKRTVPEKQTSVIDMIQAP